MGNTDLNTACSPVSSRRSGATSFCRNCSYDRLWISMRFGISTMDGILPKSLRTRRPHWIVPAIHPPRPDGFWPPGAQPRRTGRGHTLVEGGARPRSRLSRACGGYFTSTVAPTSSSFFFMSAASALATFSLTGLGAPSTRSLASLRPRPVSSRTTLITWIFLSPAALRTTSNSVFSSVAAAPPPAAAPPAAGAAAAADTPHFSCKSLESWDASSSVRPSSFSAISSMFVAMSSASVCGCCYVVMSNPASGRLGRALAPGIEHVHELPERCLQQAHELSHRSLHGAHDLAPELLLGRKIRQGLELRRLHNPALHQPELDLQLRVGPHEGLQRLRDRHRVLLGEHESRRALEMGAERVEGGALDGQPGQSILDHLVLRGGALELLAQVRQLLDAEPAILGQHRALRGAQPLLQGLDAVHLLLSRHVPAPCPPRRLVS